MESSGVVLSRSTATELGLPGYQEPGKLSYGTEKGCPWRSSEGCLGTGGGLAGGRLGCPYPPAPPCLRDTLCPPKDGAELPPLPPRNGQPKAGWAEPCKDHPGARWAEAVLAPLALYSHRPNTAGKPHAAAGDGASDPPTFCHCPFLVEAKHSPFLLSSLLHPLFLLQPSVAGGCGGPWVGTRAHAADFPPELGSGRPSESKDLEYQSLGGTGEPDPSPPLTDGHYPPALAKPEQPPACLCATPGCDGCPGVGCGVLGPFEPSLGIPGGHFPCPPSNHTKLKKTWLTRHSEQSLPRCKAPRRDGGPELASEGKRPGKRPHGTTDGPCAAGEGAGATKRVTKATVAMAWPGGGTESGGDPWCLQSVPCVTLPESIPRCCACAARLNIDGFSTLGEADGDTALRLEGTGPERGSRGAGSSLCLAKYLLGVLGDPFCEAVRRDRDVWPGAPGGPEGAPQLCDSCRRGFFNSHWSCARCGFQLCPDCHRSRQEADGHGTGTGMGMGSWERGEACKSGVSSPWGLVLTRLWKLLHEVRAKFGIESHCPCGEGAAEPPGGSQGGPASPGQPPPRGTVQTATLCDLLASTAVKLCLGQDGVRMAFAPVSPALPSDNRLTSILDSIIARVVERKIQERQAGGEMNPPSPTNPLSSPDPPASHCILAPSGLLWLHDPGHPTNYKLFQEHWRRGQPVLVSGLQKRLEGGLWGPESFRSAWGERAVEAANLRAPGNRVRMSSREFWEGFAASGGKCAMSLWGLECHSGV
uniref:Lysine-specific demethylase n=1 Tax=Calidris pygmaea TaxID=425635 RepID=A0A8C3KL08_9CHAR